MADQIHSNPDALADAAIAAAASASAEQYAQQQPFLFDFLDFTPDSTYVLMESLFSQPPAIGAMTSASSTTSGTAFGVSPGMSVGADESVGLQRSPTSPSDDSPPPPRQQTSASYPTSIVADTTTASQAESPTPPPGRGKRRPHRKSRTGCRTCKRRRVKCDEVHPRCGHCMHLGLTCSFQSAAQMIENETAIARTGCGVSSAVVNGVMLLSGMSGSTFSEIPNGATGLDLADLRLMHVYSSRVHTTIATATHTKEEDLWGRRVPAVASNDLSLMHAILAVASSYVMHKHVNAETVHAASFGDSCETTEQADARHAAHKTYSLRILKSGLHNHIEAAAGDALLLTGYLLTIDAIANAPTSKVTTTEFLTRTAWVQLVRGTCCILKAVWPLQRGTLGHSIFADDFSDLPIPRSRMDLASFAKQLRPFSFRNSFVIPAISHLSGGVERRDPTYEAWLYEDEDDLEDLYPLQASSLYVMPCYMLAKFKSVAIRGRKQVMSLIIAFLGLFDGRFYAQFHANDPIAHRIIAEFYRALRVFARCHRDEIWWLTNLAEGEGIKIDT
ncbi:uncharacterized protein V1518DRAFT_419980 [Limtongia smithiae]|uniref:uncharacterized protein n=1 Tax=Limtongia smithiae TaxID=1125753 RepID=UPI0034CFB1FA